MSMFGVPYSPIVPSFTRWASGARSDRVDHVQRVDDVVRLGEDGVLAVLHRVGRAGHLAVVHDRLGLELAEQPLGDVPFGEVALGEPDLLAGDVLPGGDAVGQPGGDRREGVRAGFLVRAATQVVVDDVDLVAALGEPHRGRPSEVPVAAQDQDAHGWSFRCVRAGRRHILPAGLTPGRPGPRGPDRPRPACGSGRSRYGLRRRFPGCPAARTVPSRSSARPT